MLASGGVLRRNKTQPSRHVTCCAELAAVACCSDERSRAERTGPGNREQPPHGLLTMHDRFDFFRQLGEAQDQATQWLWTYNNDRPNMGIGGITPAMKLRTAA